MMAASLVRRKPGVQLEALHGHHHRASRQAFSSNRDEIVTQTRTCPSPGAGHAGDLCVNARRAADLVMQMFHLGVATTCYV